MNPIFLRVVDYKYCSSVNEVQTEYTLAEILCMNFDIDWRLEQAEGIPSEWTDGL